MERVNYTLSVSLVCWYYTLMHYTARHDTLNTFHLEEIPLDHTNPDGCMYTYSVQNVHSNAHKVIAGFFLSSDPEVT
jgi:hypothetical protein